MKSRKSGSRSSLDDLVAQNVAAITRIEEAAYRNRSRSDHVAEAVAKFCGSIAFVYVHCAFFAGWLLWNCLPGVDKQFRFDPAPFNILTLIVALEVIFLSTFILISQNRQQRIADQRNHLDLQINMLAEQENSQMLAMLKQIMDHLGLDCDNSAVPNLEEETDHERVAEQIIKGQEEIGKADDVS